MIDFRIDTFLAVCQYMNYTKAAEALRITPPAVTQHIHYLEEHFGVKLFQFQGRRPVLTEAGQLLRDAATTLKHDEIYLREKLLDTTKRGKLLALGATKTVGAYLLPQALAGFLSRNPEADVHITMDNTKILLDELDQGKIDCALVEGSFEKDQYDFLIYSVESFVAVSKSDYPFKGKVNTVEDLLDERLIVREAGSGTRNILESYLKRHNLVVADFAHVTEMNNVTAIKELVKQGAGITFLYGFAVQEELKQGTLKTIPLAHFSISHNITFLWRRGSIFRAYYEQLFEALGGKPHK